MSKKKQESMATQLAAVKESERLEQATERRETIINPALDNVMDQLARLPIAEEFDSAADDVDMSILRRSDAIVAFRQSDALKLAQTNMHMELMDRPGIYQTAYKRVKAIRHELYSNPVIDGIKVWSPPKGSAITDELEHLEGLLAEMLKVAQDSIQADIDGAVSIEDQKALELVTAEQTLWKEQNKAAKEAK